LDVYGKARQRLTNASTCAKSGARLEISVVN